MSDLTLAHLLADQMEYSAEWRQDKAEEYPDDKQRNLDCAAEFLDMAERLRGFRGGFWYERYCLLVGDDNLNYRMSEELQSMTEAIHFTAQEPEEFFKEIIENSDAEPGPPDLKAVET